MKKLNKILVVEDDIIIRGLLEKVLNQKYEVISTDNPRHALDILSKNGDIDYVVTDYNLRTNMNGGELADRIKETYHLPVTIFTAAPDVTSEEHEVIYKPHAQKLLEAIEEYFRARYQNEKAS